MKTLMRNGRDRRSENPLRATRGKNACFCLGPISGSHQGQQPKRLHSKAEYMAAPERFAETSDSFPLHRGRRPYMARTRRADAPWQLSDHSAEANLLRPSCLQSLLTLTGPNECMIFAAHIAAPRTCFVWGIFLF